jgi:tetratricopeptide (TPR) repeat protein
LIRCSARVSTYTQRGPQTSVEISVTECLPQDGEGRLAGAVARGDEIHSVGVVQRASYLLDDWILSSHQMKPARDEVQHSWELNPLNSVINASVGMIHYLAHDYHGALVALRRGLEVDPTHYVSHLRVGLVCLQKNLPNEAIDAMRQAVVHSGGSTEALAGLAQAHAVAGDTPAMARIVKELGESGHRYVSPYNVAIAYGAIGDKHRALEWLERAYQEHNPDLIELAREPSFASLRSDAKFREL